MEKYVITAVLFFALICLCIWIARKKYLLKKRIARLEKDFSEQKNIIEGYKEKESQLTTSAKEQQSKIDFLFSFVINTNIVDNLKDYIIERNTNSLTSTFNSDNKLFSMRKNLYSELIERTKPRPHNPCGGEIDE